MARRKEVALGEAPKALDVDIAKDVDKMRRDELMKYAKEVLKVETRQRGPDGKIHISLRPSCEARL